LRALLGAVALVGVGLYFRPGQVHPRDVPIGASKAWVYWNCGSPFEAYDDDPGWYDGPYWSYYSPYWVDLTFDSSGHVDEVFVLVYKPGPGK